MIPAHIDERMIIRPPSEVNAVVAVLRKIVIAMDRGMDRVEPTPTRRDRARMKVKPPRKKRAVKEAA